MWRSVVTLGTFDGVHRGHQALIQKVVRRAHTLRMRSVVLSFGMPPRHADEPRQKPVLLTTLPEKLRMMKRLGVDRVQVLVFDKKTASTRPEDFFHGTILKKHQAREMVVGPRVAFGKNRAGRLPLLRRLGRTHGVRIHVVSSIARGQSPVSSRRIRAHLLAGRVEKANALLGYPYSLEGRVIHGNRRGRLLGFPTANLAVDPAKMMPRGVYWVKVHPSRILPMSAKEALKGDDALCNVGVRPTFTPRSQQLHCEVFLLNRHSDLYGRKLRVSFLRRIRAEKRFASSSALQQQICRDVARARLYRNAHFSI